MYLLILSAVHTYGRHPLHNLGRDARLLSTMRELAWPRFGQRPSRASHSWLRGSPIVPQSVKRIDGLGAHHRFIHWSDLVCELAGGTARFAKHDLVTGAAGAQTTKKLHVLIGQHDMARLAGKRRSSAPLGQDDANRRTLLDVPEGRGHGRRSGKAQSCASCGVKTETLRDLFHTARWRSASRH